MNTPTSILITTYLTYKGFFVIEAQSLDILSFVLDMAINTPDAPLHCYVVTINQKFNLNLSENHVVFILDALSNYLQEYSPGHIIITNRMSNIITTLNFLYHDFYYDYFSEEFIRKTPSLIYLFFRFLLSYVFPYFGSFYTL